MIIFILHLFGSLGFIRFEGVRFILIRFFYLRTNLLFLLFLTLICISRYLDLVMFLLSSLILQGIYFCSLWIIRNLPTLIRSFLYLLCLMLNLPFLPFESMCLFLIHFPPMSWFMILMYSSGFGLRFYLPFSDGLLRILLLGSLLHYSDLSLDFECEGNVGYCSSSDAWVWESWQLTRRPDFCAWPFFWMKLACWEWEGWVWVYLVDCCISSWFFFWRDIIERCTL